MSNTESFFGSGDEVMHQPKREEMPFPGPDRAPIRVPRPVRHEPAPTQPPERREEPAEPAEPAVFPEKEKEDA